MITDRFNATQQPHPIYYARYKTNELKSSAVALHLRDNSHDEMELLFLKDLCEKNTKRLGGKKIDFGNAADLVGVYHYRR
jgi:hypothetical protein